ncbi:MAG: diguanylate cyclase [Coriobacteriales bacterium]|nr:diguanylate cyclase [Coriobacteriales bacterium]
MNGSSFKAHRKRRVALVAVLIAVSIGSLLAIFYFLESNSCKSTTFQTLSVLINHFEQTLTTNEMRTDVLQESVKEDYITRAHSIASLLDKNPELENNHDELVKLADLLSVDEIYIFDETGTIIHATNLNHIGLNFDSGDQIGYFKPMLKNKSLEMCQDITPNTADEQPMMYAMCWNSTGTRMVQVGVEPVRLLSEFNSTSVPEVVESIGLTNGVDIFVANRFTREIVASSTMVPEGSTLPSLGLNLRAIDLLHIQTGEGTLSGEPTYYAAHAFKSYIIVCTQSIKASQDGIEQLMLVVFAYLATAAAVIVLIMRKMTNVIVEEQRNATEDSMTELGNRRAYERTIEHLEKTRLDKRFAYMSLDLNGLKVVNDTLGHEMGDKLIRGCASCIRDSLGHCGELFRVGGDEFAALIYEEEDELEAITKNFEKKQEEWSKENGLELSISWGVATVRHHPEANISELAQIADAKMYEAKQAHYEKLGKKPRSTQADSRR